MSDINKIQNNTNNDDLSDISINNSKSDLDNDSKNDLDNNSNDTRICNRCKKDKLLTHFPRDKNCKYGRKYTCKPCAIKLTQTYKQNNKELISEYNKKYREANREKVMAYYKKSDEEKEKNRLIKRQLYFDETIKIVNDRGGKMLSTIDDYITSRNKLKIQCCNNHIFSASSNDVNKSWCPKCKVNKGELICKNFIEYALNAKFEKIRPDWLITDKNSRLELDMYNDEYKIAIEYNGIQHYKYFHFFHRTKENFIKQVFYDAYKYIKCKEMNVYLITVPYLVALDNIPFFIITMLNLNGYDIKYDIIDSFNKNKAFIDTNIKDKVMTIIDNKKGKLIDCIFQHKDNNITIQCEHNHIWTTKIKYLLLNRWCIPCSHVINKTTKQKLSQSISNFYKTDEGKKRLKESFEKRSITMEKQRIELRNNIKEKKCNNCLNIKPVSEYNIKKAAKDGLQTNCKVCVNDLKKMYRKKNKIT